MGLHGGIGITGTYVDAKQQCEDADEVCFAN